MTSSSLPGSAAAAGEARRSLALPGWASGAVGLVVVIAVWWTLAATVFSNVGPGGI